MIETTCFLPRMVHLVRLGEETGQLEDLLTQAGVQCSSAPVLQCEECLDQLQSQFLPITEPALMLLRGFVIGGIILAMYLPVFSMGDLFSFVNPNQGITRYLLIVLPSNFLRERNAGWSHWRDW